VETPFFPRLVTEVWTFLSFFFFTRPAGGKELELLPLYNRETAPLFPSSFFFFPLPAMQGTGKEWGRPLLPSDHRESRRPRRLFFLSCIRKGGKKGSTVGLPFGKGMRSPFSPPFLPPSSRGEIFLGRRFSPLPGKNDRVPPFFFPSLPSWQGSR